MAKNASDVLWDCDDSEPRHTLYPVVPFVSNPVWRQQLFHLVYDWWFPAVRMLYLRPEGHRWAYQSEARFSTALKMQIGIQERIHVASSKNRTMAVRGWANVPLNEDDKKRISEARVSVEEMLQDLGDLVFKGYRFSMTWDDYSQAQQASLVCANPESPNYEFGLSARHPDPELALRSLMYKYGLTLEKPWPEWVKERRVDNWS